MGYHHGAGYAALDDCEIAACADIKRENAEAFAEHFGVPGVYTDYREMLEKETLDIVSVCTWPHLHAEMTIAAAESGVKAVHCEKPMAPTWGEARRMAEACERRGVQLTFSHQRRFGAPFRKAREMAHDGTIGELLRLEGQCGNLYDWGTHWFDMFFLYNNETPAEWVIGQIDCREPNKIFGVKMEHQGISQVKFKNGVSGLLVTGGAANMGCSNRLIGTDGVIEVGVGEKQVPLRFWGKGETGWREPPLDEGLHGPMFFERAIADAVDALKTGREPELSAQRALRATEVIFATYESSRRRARVDLPLDIDDSPLLSMLESGEISTEI